MGRLNYLGGSTIIGPRTNPYRLDNFAPSHLDEDNECTRVFVDGRIDDDLGKELSDMDFDFVRGLFGVFQHAYLHRDVTGITRLANLNDPHGLGNYILRIANMIVVGRRWGRKRGAIEVTKVGKLGFEIKHLVGIYRTMIALREEWDDLPQVSDDILHLVAKT